VKAKSTSQNKNPFWHDLADVFAAIVFHREHLMQAERELREIMGREKLIGHIVHQFWLAGGITNEDFYYWFRKKGRWATSSQVQKKHQLRIVSNRSASVHQLGKRVRLIEPDPDGNEAA
jgi:hypothetical protein